jgi:microcystin synthetase protein McyJ
MLDGIKFGLKYLKDRVVGSKSVSAYYERIGDDVLPSLNDNFLNIDKPLWLNLGYWKTARKYPDACRDLATYLGEIAEFNKSDYILDCGFGFAEQDFLWINKFQPEKITGINITPLHIDVAKKRLEISKFRNKIDFQFGSATEMKFPDNEFTKVVALESAFHFESREKFFKESYRVLKKNGMIATADMLPLPGEKFKTIWKYKGRRDLYIPEENMYDRNEYKNKLEMAGFKNVKVISIASDVYEGMRKYLLSRAFDRKSNPFSVVINLDEKDYVSGKGPKMWGNSFGTSDYIVACGEKK